MYNQMSQQACLPPRYSETPVEGVELKLVRSTLKARNNRTWPARYVHLPQQRGL